MSRKRIGAVALIGVLALCGVVSQCMDSGSNEPTTPTTAPVLLVATAAPTTAMPTATTAPPTATTEPPTSTALPPTDEPTQPPAPATAPPTQPPAQPTTAPLMMVSGPVDDLASAPPDDQPWLPCARGQVKGNRNTMIYHVPGGASYGRTFRNVYCFNSADEARAAGYRAANN
jgi:hypothetical protein